MTRGIPVRGIERRGSKKNTQSPCQRQGIAVPPSARDPSGTLWRAWRSRAGPSAQSAGADLVQLRDRRDRPAEVLLDVHRPDGGQSRSGSSPGEGPKYRRGPTTTRLSRSSLPIELIRRGLEKLEQEPSDVVIVAPENLPGEFMSDFVAVSLVPIEELLRETRSTRRRSRATSWPIASGSPTRPRRSASG